MTIGDHLRKKRLDRDLLQREVALLLRSTECSVYIWETNRTSPTLPFLPRIIEFLGYCPYDPDWTPGERLIWIRKYLGLSQEAMARRLKVDPGTLAKWETGKKEPMGGFLIRLQKLLASHI